MKKFLLVLCVLGGLGWYGYREYNVRQFLATLNKALTVENGPKKTELAIQLARMSLAEVKHPNLYALVTPATMQQMTPSLAKLSETVPNVAYMKDLQMTPLGLTSGDGTVSVKATIEGSLTKPPIVFKAMIEVTAAPRIAGTDLEFVPLDAQLTVSKVSLNSTEDERILPSVIRTVSRPIVDYVVSRVGALSIPINLGVAKEINLSEMLSAVKEIKITEGGRSKVYLAFESLAAFPTKEGLHLIGSGRFVSQQEVDQSIDELTQLARARPREESARSTCNQCVFSWADVNAYLLCTRKLIDCRTDSLLALHPGDRFRLSPVQALSLRLLGQRNDPQSKNTFKMLEYLLQPVLTATPSSTATAGEGPGELRATILKLRDEVEPEASFASNASVVAIRKDLLATSVNQIAGLIAPKGVLTVEQRQEHINYTIKSPPTPDLKCDQNARGCPSDFSYPGYNPRGCSSGCGTRNCVRIFGGEVCVNGLDLNCQAQKTDCERLKESEKIGYETAKAAAQAQWTLAKLDCERLKATELAGCKINQEWLRITGDQELGRIEGDATVSNAQASAAVHSFQISPDLESISLGATVGGNAGLSASFIFTPLNAGHIACVAQWGGNVSASASLAQTEIGLMAALDKTKSSQAIVYNMGEIQNGLRLIPPPAVALLSQNPHMALVCPAVGALIGASPLSVALALPLLDTVPVKVPSSEIRLPVASGDFLAGLPNSKLQLRFGSRSILLFIE